MEMDQKDELSCSTNNEDDCLLEDFHCAIENQAIQQITLHTIVERGDANTLHHLLNNGVDVDELDQYGITPLIYACESHQIEIMEILLQYNADVNHKTLQFFTPLHHAVCCNNVEAVTLLLECEAQVDIQDSKGNTPLHLAALKGYVEICKLLKDVGASPEIKNNAKETPLGYAKKHDELYDILQPIDATKEVQSSPEKQNVNKNKDKEQNKYQFQPSFGGQNYLNNGLLQSGMKLPPGYRNSVLNNNLDNLTQQSLGYNHNISNTGLQSKAGWSRPLGSRRNSTTNGLQRRNSVTNIMPRRNSINSGVQNRAQRPLVSGGSVLSRSMSSNNMQPLPLGSSRGVLNRSMSIGSIRTGLNSKGLQNNSHLLGSSRLGINRGMQNNSQRNPGVNQRNPGTNRNVNKGMQKKPMLLRSKTKAVIKSTNGRNSKEKLKKKKKGKETKKDKKKSICQKGSKSFSPVNFELSKKIFTLHQVIEELSNILEDEINPPPKYTDPHNEKKQIEDPHKEKTQVEEPKKEKTQVEEPKKGKKVKKQKTKKEKSKKEKTQIEELKKDKRLKKQKTKKDKKVNEKMEMLKLFQPCLCGIKLRKRNSQKADLDSDSD